MEEQTNRLLPLEGLRGVAAVVVVLFHSLLIFYPAFFYGPTLYVSGVHGFHFEDKLFGTPLNVFLSGTFAVAIFFVISGFVLTIGFFQTGDETIIRRLAAKRYIRLMLPALASIVIVWAVLALGLNGPKVSTEAITHSYWLGPLWIVEPSLIAALTQGVWGVFTAGDVSYNPVLWTMQFELIGSFIVFSIALLFKQYKLRWVVYILLLFGTYNTWYAGFVIGMILADLYAHKLYPFFHNRTSTVVVLLILGLLAGGYPAISSQGTFYAAMKLSWLSETQNQIFYLTLGATFVFIAVLTLRPLMRFFGSKFISQLGKYTFSLYLIHMVVLFTVCTSFFLLFHGALGYNKAALISILLTVPFIMFATYLFEKYIDAPAIHVSGVFSNWLLELPQERGETVYSTRQPHARTKRVLRSIQARFGCRPK